MRGAARQSKDGAESESCNLLGDRCSELQFSAYSMFNAKLPCSSTTDTERFRASSVHIRTGRGTRMSEGANPGARVSSGVR